MEYMESSKKRVSAGVLVIYFLSLIILWFGVEMFLWPQLDNILKNYLLLRIIKSGIIKNIVWTLPAMILILNYKDKMYVSLREMFANSVNWVKYVPLFALFTVIVLIDGYIINGRVAVSADFQVQHLIIVAFVGITEEGVFRGWLLNAMIGADSNKRARYAILINGLLFLAIHFPRWIAEDIFLSNFFNLSFLGIIILSVIFSQAFVRSKSLLVPITLHMYWDLLMFMFV